MSSNSCKYCGATNLHWFQTFDNKWQLLDKNNNRHKCVITKKVANNAPSQKVNIKNDPQINKALKEFKKRLDEDKSKKVYFLKRY